MSNLPKGANSKQASWNVKVGDTVEFIRNASFGEKIVDVTKWKKRVIKEPRYKNHQSTVKFIGEVKKIFVGNRSKRGYMIDEDKLAIDREKVPSWKLQGNDVLIMKKKTIFILNEDGSVGRKIPNSYFKTYNPKTKKETSGDYTYGVQRRDVKAIVKNKKGKGRKKKSRKGKKRSGRRRKSYSTRRKYSIK